MYSLFSPEVLACGAISGGTYVVILLVRAFAEDILAGLRWLWLLVWEYLLIVFLVGLIMLACYAISLYPWAKTAFKGMAITITVVSAIVYVIVYGANQDSK